MNRPTPLWHASLNLHDHAPLATRVTPALKHADTIAESYPARAVVAENARVIDRAIGIVARAPFFMDARRDGERMHVLTVDGPSGIAELVWSSGAGRRRVAFPAFLLDLCDGEAAEWARRQGAMLEQLVGDALGEPRAAE